jgi:hypothetical protein
MVEIKLKATIKVKLAHNDANFEPTTFSTTTYQNMIKIAIPDDVIEVFRKLWGTNRLIVTIEGEKKFRDGMVIE